MANSLHLSREVKVYVSFADSIWEVPVLDGYSFSQSTNTSEVTLAEMADSSLTSRRGRKMFTDSVAPAEFSFSTYARPYTVDNSGTDEHHAVEEVLWAMFAGAPADSFNPAGGAGDPGIWTDVITQITTAAGDDIVGTKVDFASSNKITFATAKIYFHFPASAAGGTDLWYELDEAVLTEASVAFDIDGITTINWSGQARKLSEPGSAPVIASAINNATTQTGNFIRNRLTQLAITSAEGGNILASYNVVLTGGNVTFNNEVNYVTPSSLGLVNEPLGHVMGSRMASGSFTCYVDHNAGSSADLFDDLLASKTLVTNSFKLIFDVGGASAPQMRFVFPQAHIEIPTHSIEDVISVETNFHALPSDISSTDEATITYVGAPAQ